MTHEPTNWVKKYSNHITLFCGIVSFVFSCGMLYSKLNTIGDNQDKQGAKIDLVSVKVDTIADRQQRNKYSDIFEKKEMWNAINELRDKLQTPRRKTASYQQKFYKEVHLDGNPNGKPTLIAVK